MKALLNSMLIIRTIFTLTLVAAASVAHADSKTYTATVPTTLTDFSTTFDLAKFNNSLGTLTSVEISISGFGTTDITATNNSTSSAATLTGVSTQLYLVLTSPTVPAILANQELNGGLSVTPPSSIATLAKSGGSFDSGLLALAGTAGIQEIASNLGVFVGSGDILFNLDTFTYTSQQYRNGNVGTSQATNAGANVTITYNFEDAPPPVVPEPGTLVLFGTGLLGLAGLLRLKFMHSH